MATRRNEVWRGNDVRADSWPTRASTRGNKCSPQVGCYVLLRLRNPRGSPCLFRCVRSWPITAFFLEITCQWSDVVCSVTPVMTSGNWLFILVIIVMSSDRLLFSLKRLCSLRYACFVTEESFWFRCTCHWSDHVNSVAFAITTTMSVPLHLSFKRPCPFRCTCH